jgi:hypothetical protein
MVVHTKLEENKEISEREKLKWGKKTTKARETKKKSRRNWQLH